MTQTHLVWAIAVAVVLESLAESATAGLNADFASMLVWLSTGMLAFFGALLIARTKMEVNG